MTHDNEESDMSEEQIGAAIKTTKKATAAARKAHRLLDASRALSVKPANLPQMEREVRRLHEALAYVEGYVERETSSDEEVN
jgi:hypothetical protein